MGIDKSLISGSTSMLILKLIEEQDMYGYQMIEELAGKSDNTFALKAGTLYPLLHNLEQQGLLTAYDGTSSSARTRKYYAITPKGKNYLKDKQAEWTEFSLAINRVLSGGACCVAY